MGYKRIEDFKELFEMCLKENGDVFHSYNEADYGVAVESHDISFFNGKTLNSFNNGHYYKKLETKRKMTLQELWEYWIDNGRPPVKQRGSNVYKQININAMFPEDSNVPSINIHEDKWITLERLYEFNEGFQINKDTLVPFEVAE